ncbi:MAG: LptF/LptG family permease, partial [Planctomycetota bacterium]
MGLTLIGYIFRDLLKVFGLAAFVIAGIMSFAGLLRPLTERGLAADQAVTILAWLLPAMTTYSLPVAALFATTFVYGRLSADNETTAIRAAGVPTGVTGIAFPALMLGIGASFVSLVLLCFIVPAANLQVERVIYSNVARLAANEINRSKRLILSGTGSNITLNADRAILMDITDLPQAAREQAERSTGFGISPRTQIVRFENVYVMKYDNRGSKKDKYEVPIEIFTAEAANGFIEPPQGVGDEDWRERIFNSG